MNALMEKIFFSVKYLFYIICYYELLIFFENALSEFIFFNEFERKYMEHF